MFQATSVTGNGLVSFNYALGCLVVNKVQLLPNHCGCQHLTLFVQVWLQIYMAAGVGLWLALALVTNISNRDAPNLLLVSALTTCPAGRFINNVQQVGGMLAAKQIAMLHDGGYAMMEAGQTPSSRYTKGDQC